MIANLFFFFFFFLVSVVFCLVREYFAYMETLPLSVKECKTWVNTWHLPVVGPWISKQGGGGGVRRPWVRLRPQFFSPGSQGRPSLGSPRRQIREKHRWVYNLRGWRTGVYTVLEWENIVFWFKCINYHLFHKQEPFFSKLTFWNSNSVKNKQWNLLIKFRNWNHNILKFGNTLEIHQRMR